MARIRSYVLRSFVGLLLSFCLNAQTGPLFHGCAIEGDATQTTRSDPALNLLKNRTNSPSDFETTHFDDLAAMEVPDGVSKKRRDHWPSETLQAVEAQERRAVRVTGFFLKVKLEGPESPNCHGDNQGDRDFHIWLANSADDERSDAVVVELTPRIRAQHPSWSRTNLNRLIANKTRVRVSGWVLLDPEHPDQVGKTRVTIWEIHPIMVIEVFSGGQWRGL